MGDDIFSNEKLRATQLADLDRKSSLAPMIPRPAKTHDPCPPVLHRQKSTLLETKGRQ